MNTGRTNYLIIIPFFCVTALVLGATSHSATVTVDPLAAPVAGSIYTTLIQAVEDNAFIGDAWADGNGDTVLLSTNAPHIVETNVDILGGNIDPQRTFTIRTAGPGPAVVVGDPLFVKDVKAVFECSRSGTYYFEGITIIGSPTKNGAHESDDPLGYRMNGAWKIESDGAGEETTVTIRDCVVTANDGSNNPVLDYSGTFPSDNVGVFIRGFYINDDKFRGQSLKVTVEDSVFAYSIGRVGSGEGGANHMLKTHDSANLSATEEVIFRNCLFANCPNASGFTIGGATAGNSVVTFEDCLITHVAENSLLLSMTPNDNGDQWGAPEIHLVHTILDSPESPISNIRSGSNEPFTGSLILDEVTLNSPGQDAISFSDHIDGTGAFDLSDVIASNVSSLFRLQPDPGAGSGPAPLSLTAASLATNSAALNTQAPLVQSTLNAAVVTSDDPTFLDTTFDSNFAGIRRWDSAPNLLFDVGNSAYAGLGTGGADLRGGADFAGGPPPPAASSINRWFLYE